MGQMPMSWTGIYRLALRLLPVELRRKHGPAMETLFARELGRARERGRLAGVFAGAAGVWDVVQRAAYERVRPGRDDLSERRDDRPPERWNMNTPRQDLAGAVQGSPSMPTPTTWQLLRRHAAPFAIAFVALTASLLALYATRRLPELSARGVPTGTLVEGLLLAVPFTAAVTIPMAVFIAVLRVFTRLGAEGTLAVARREPAGVRRLVAPVLAAAVGVGALALLLTAQLVPRANGRLAAVLASGAAAQTDRTMTIGELRAAARDVRRDAGPDVLARTASYEVEIQKKYALAAACVVLALAGAAIALRFPRGGAGLVIGASCAVFGAYYVCLIAGESLADRLVVSPFVAMWGANVLLLAAALLAAWRSRSSLAPRGTGPLAIGG
jgi:lipopolysaccharide export LptBFGC system permease protein LptF